MSFVIVPKDLVSRPEDYIKKPTLADIIREYFPNASDEFCEYVLWEKTGYPSFWNIPKDGKTPEECFRKQLLDFKNEEK